MRDGVRAGWVELCEEEKRVHLGGGGRGKGKACREKKKGEEVERQSF